LDGAYGIAVPQLRLRQMSGVENAHHTFGKMRQQI
jgi:hypothetical protein